MKTLTKKQIKEVAEEIKMMLHASRDCLRNLGEDTRKITYRVNDGYFGEAFGVMRGLKILGYGYFGSSNLDGIEERKCKIKEQNLQWWFSQLEYKVLEEEGWGTDNRCEYCLKKYKKDSTMFEKREKE